jgi:hypothetical protein
VADLASLAAEYEKPKKKSGGSDLAALALAHKEAPAEAKPKQPQQPKPQPIALADLKGYGEEKAATAIGQAALKASAKKAPPKPAAKEKPKDFVNLSSPASQVKKDPSLAKGGVLRQVNLGAKSATEAVGAGVAPIINRAGTTLYPVRDFFNVLADERGKLGAKYPGKPIPIGEQNAMLARALARSRPWESVKKAVIQGKATEFEAFKNWAAQDPAFKKALQKRGVSPAVLDFIASVPIDAVAGGLVNRVVGGAQKAVTGQKVTLLPGTAAKGKKLTPEVSFKGADVQAAAEKAIPPLGKALQGRRAYRSTAERFNLRAAQQEEPLRRVAEVAEDLKVTSRMYQKKGANIRVKDPLTNRPVNKLDQLVADYQEAGARGSRHEVVSGGGKGPSIQKQQKQLATAQQVLPKRAKLAAGAKQKAQAAKAELQQTQAAKEAAQQKLQVERKAAGEAAETARKAREQAQAAVKQRAEAATVEAQRRQSLAKLRDTQAERAAALKKAESAVPALERDAAAAGRQHASARSRAEQLQGQVVAAEKRVATAKQQAARAKVPEVKQQRLQAAEAARRDADALRQQAKQASANEANMLRQLQAREQEAERARAAAAQARRLTPSTAALQLARQRANEAAQRVAKTEAQAQQEQAATRQAWGQAKQAQQPVTAATRDAGKAQQLLFEKQKAATRAEKAATRLTQRAAGAQVKVGVLGTQLSTPVQRAGMQARRAVELREVAKEAAQHGIAFEDVKRLGDRYGALGEELGQKLVAAGKMAPETFERLRGFHLPRIYSLAASKPKEARKILQELERKGLISTEAAKDLGVEISAKARGTSNLSRPDFTDQRTVDTFAARMDPAAGRLAEGSATPAMTRYAQNVTTEAAEAEALRDVVKNPALALPEGQAPRHWEDALEVDGVKYRVDPGVQRYLNARGNGEILDKALRLVSPSFADGWRRLNKNMRALWMSAPPSAINNAAGNYGLGAGAAAMNEAQYSLPRYLVAAREYKVGSKAKTVPQYLDEFDNLTDLGAEGGGVLPRGSREVGSGFGVETMGQRVKQGLQQGWETYTNALLRDPEKSARYYLYKELRLAGKDVDEAARIVRAAMIDYSDVGWVRKLVDQNNLLPFLTFPTKAFFQYANLAMRRPDLFQTWTGERLRDLMDSLTDESMLAQGKTPEEVAAKGARARRQSGAAGITSFPIPGQLDSQGQPLYLRSGALAPIAMMAPFGRPDEPMDPLQFATERYRTSVPLFRTLGELATNTNTFRKGEPIVKPGTVPGALSGDIRDAWRNPEALGAYALHAGKAFVPQIGQAERLYHAATDTTAFPGRYAPQRTLGQALLQTFTGAAVQEGMADTGLEKKERAGARADARHHAPFVEFSNNYELRIIDGKEPRKPQYVADAAQQKTLYNAQKTKEALVFKLKDILTSDYFTGEDRYRQIRMHLDALYALGDRIEELAAKEEAGGAATGQAQ